MNLKKEQLKLQTQTIYSLQEKTDKKISKKSAQTKSLELFQTKYLKSLGASIDEERREHLPTVIAKFYKSEEYREQIVTILNKPNILDYKLDDIAKEVAHKLLDYVTSKQIFFLNDIKDEADKELLLFTFEILLDQLKDIESINVDLKLQQKQKLALSSFLITPYEIAWIIFQSIAKLVSNDLYDEEDNSTSGIALSKLIVDDLFHHIKFRLKSFKNRMLIDWNNSSEIEMGLELFKFLMIHNILDEYEKDGRFVNYKLHSEFEKNTKKLYADMFKYSTPFFEPMIVLPTLWTTIDDGGFLRDENNCTKFNLYIMKAQTKRDRENLEAKRENFSLKLLEAINIIQATKWKINSKMLEVITLKFKVEQKRQKKEISVLNRRYKETHQKQKNYEELEIESEELDNKIKALKSEKSHLSKKINKIKNEFKIIELSLKTAKKYEKYSEIYFVYQIDFRGRLYPVQALLNPQGDDLNKSLLYFSQKRLVTDKGLKWFKIHGANSYGVDKVSFEDRIKWVNDHSKEIERVAKSDNPFEDEFIKELKKPYQFLAFAYEYSEYLKNPHQFYSSLPIAVDGSNNGFQHISALLRDIEGAKKVNVLPDGNDIPADIYKEVAQETKKSIERDKEIFEKEKKTLLKDENGLYFKMGKAKDEKKNTIEIKKIDPRSFLDDIVAFIDRDLVKQNVMTDAYGAGKDAKALQIQDKLEDKKELTLNEENLRSISTYLAKLNQESIDKLAPSSNIYKKWMKKIAKDISKLNRAIEWTTPFMGLEVIQEEFITEKEKVSTKYNNKDHKILIRVPTDKIHEREQVKGIAPNFIHSLDATHMYLTVLDASQKGLDSFATVHDSFATYADDVDDLIESLKSEFINLTNADVIARFKTEIQERYTIEIENIEYLDKDHFEIEKIRESKYFFA